MNRIIFSHLFICVCRSFRSRTALTLLLLTSITHCASAQYRHALVIGNDTYPGNQLQNARNDARAVYGSLKASGYESTLVLDATHTTISDKLDTFLDSVKPGDTVVLYYAGHGFQLDGENYLVPVDFKVSTPDAAKQQGYSLSSILERFSSHGATTQIVILDACRDNPFLGSRSLRGGWAGFGTSAGSFLAFGTSPGSTASDDPSDGHGLFTKDLLPYLTASNQDIEEMLRKVREDVIRDSGGKQVPWIASSLIGSFHIRPELDAGTKALAPIQPGLGVSIRDVNRSLAEPVSDKADPISPYESAQLSRAVDLVRGAKLQMAATILEELLSVNPALSIAFRILGLVLHSMGRDVDSLRTLNTAVRINPSDTAAMAYRCAIESEHTEIAPSSDCKIAIQKYSPNVVLNHN